MKIIRKIVNFGVLSLLTIIALTGCEKRPNPLLKPQMMSAFEKEIIANSSLNERRICVEYAANPASLELRKPFCSEWVQKQYENFTAKTKLEMAMVSVQSPSETLKSFDRPIPTIEEFTDPIIWGMFWVHYGEQWKTELANEKTITTPVEQKQVPKTLPATQPETQAKNQLSQQQIQAQQAAAQQAAIAQQQQQAKQKLLRQQQRQKRRRAIASINRYQERCDRYPDAAGC